MFNDAALSIAYAVAAFVEVDAVPVKFPVNVVAVIIPLALPNFIVLPRLKSPPVTLIPALAVITPTESTFVPSS